MMRPDHPLDDVGQLDDLQDLKDAKVALLLAGRAWCEAAASFAENAPDQIQRDLAITTLSLTETMIRVCSCVEKVSL